MTLLSIMFVRCQVKQKFNAEEVQQYMNNRVDDILYIEDYAVFSLNAAHAFAIISQMRFVLCFVHLIIIQNYSLFQTCRNYVITYFHCYRVVNSLLNPLTPGTFCKKCIFWTIWCFLCWISAKLSLIRSKMHLQPNSLAFLPPASRFTTL